MFNLAVIPHFLLHYKIINTIYSPRSSRPDMVAAPPANIRGGGGGLKISDQNNLKLNLRGAIKF